MSELKVPEFDSYEEEAAFWDGLDTASYMPDDGEWLQLETESKRAIRVAILPQLAATLAERARAQGVSIETLVNACLIERLGGQAAAGS